MIRFGSAQGVGLVLVLNAAPLAALRAPAAAADVAAAAQDIDALLGFVGGSALSPAQRASVAAETSA